MNNELELKLLRKIEALEKEIKKIKGENEEQIPTYQYSKIRDVDLDEIINISQKINKAKFNNWFINNIEISDENKVFLQQLLEQEESYISFYSEETLKMRFLSPLLLRVDFKTDYFKDFYNEKLIYKTDNFILTGEVDFLISTGYRRAKKPYFFIQEFKRSEEYGNPRPQLLAELISAVELNAWKQIKGAYVIGENWNFVILEKLQKDKYQYFISRTFNCTNIEDLKAIFKNLLFVKHETLKMVKNEQA
jgi:hypothetical protein